MTQFALTIFLGAFLLFEVQPLIGKHILPRFGGGPGVWTVCMLFFQIALLVGYAYAHLISTYLGRRRQLVVHGILLLGSLGLLPILPDVKSWEVAGDVAPTWQIFAMLTTQVGLPFLLLSSTGPLVQSWFSRTFPNRSPYRMYALSNIGSLLALVSYPFVLEPLFTLRAQGWAWSIGYVVYVMACGWTAWRFSLAAHAANCQIPSDEQPDGSMNASAMIANTPRAGDILLWLGLTITGSVMLLATTDQLCQDLTVVPFLWVLPLAIYLTTFIICFDRDQWYDRRLFIPLLVISVLGVVVVYQLGTNAPLSVQIGGYSLALFSCCMSCHGELVRIKPAPRYLTKFYLVVAAGGAMGGVLVAIVAPYLFNDYWEYHVGLLVSCVLAGVCTYRSGIHLHWRIGSRVGWSAMLLAILTVAGSLVTEIVIQGIEMKEVSRTFFGVLRIDEMKDSKYYGGRVMAMQHGRTLHGLQLLHPEAHLWPTTYYGRDSGLGIAIESLRRLSNSNFPGTSLRIGVVGLGAGTTAMLARKGDYLRFYEINPDVQRLAKKHFTFIEDSEAKIDVVLGDARVMLEREVATGQLMAFDVLAVDAFSSDAIPKHLLTHQAYQLYWKHLTPDGVLAFHITNRYVNLEPVVRSLVQGSDHQVISIVSPGEKRRVGTTFARWLIVTRNPDILAARRVRVAGTAWPSNDNRQQVHWTDDFASLWPVLSRKNLEGKWIGSPNDGRFVIDDADLIDRDDEDRILDLVRTLYDETNGAYPIAVLTIESIADSDRPDLTFDEFATYVFHKFSLAKRDPDAAVLILISVEDLSATLHVGEGWSRENPPPIKQVLNKILLPQLRQGSSSKGIVSAVAELDHLIREYDSNLHRTTP